MKDISEDKIGESKEELEIESEEKDRGEEIEVDEDRLPSRAMAIHEHIRRDGEKRWSATRWPCCGQPLQPVCRWAPLCSPKGYFTFSWKAYRAGFAGKFRLHVRLYYRHYGATAAFTENTVTAVLPVMQNPTLGNFGLLMRLWSVVLLGNLIGTGIAARAFSICQYLMNRPATHL